MTVSRLFWLRWTDTRRLSSNSNSPAPRGIFGADLDAARGWRHAHVWVGKVTMHSARPIGRMSSSQRKLFALGCVEAFLCTTLLVSAPSAALSATSVHYQCAMAALRFPAAFAKDSVTIAL